jgi:hypothetical protein
MLELQCDLEKRRSQPQQPSLKHLQEFDGFLGLGGKHNGLAELSESEREKFEALWTDSNGRQAFRIIRNFERRIR